MTLDKYFNRELVKMHPKIKALCNLHLNLYNSQISELTRKNQLGKILGKKTKRDVTNDVKICRSNRAVLADVLRIKHGYHMKN